MKIAVQAVAILGVTMFVAAVVLFIADKPAPGWALLVVGFLTQLVLMGMLASDSRSRVNSN